MQTLKVIDSNYLRDPGLFEFLCNRENVVVLCDYVGLEVFKAGDPVRLITETMRPLASRADQVFVLQRTVAIQRTVGAGRGFSRDMIDFETTAGFPLFYQKVVSCVSGDNVETELGQKQKEAVTLAEDAKATADAMVRVFPTFFDRLPAKDVALMRQGKGLSLTIKTALRKQAIAMTAEIHRERNISQRRIEASDLMHSITFRFALSILILMLRWLRRGTAPTNMENIRNHAFDCGVAAYATYFNGLLTRDKEAQTTFTEITQLLDEWYGVPPNA